VLRTLIYLFKPDHPLSFPTRRIYPNVEGIRNSIRVLTLTNEKFGRLKAEDLVDDASSKSSKRKDWFDLPAIRNFLSFGRLPNAGKERKERFLENRG